MSENPSEGEAPDVAQAYAQARTTGGMFRAAQAAASRKAADPPCLVSNTVRTYLLSLDVSEAAHAAAEGAKWVEERQCWALALTPEIADELGMATLARLDA
ncbi:hypothetical protein [Streptomyces turgidiscabies]|uniref:hypothetical protein n=1 Tax=Streptomyces turgidiscabies TaxID=85558 RepID=UPI0038F5DEA9